MDAGEPVPVHPPMNAQELVQELELIPDISDTWHMTFQYFCAQYFWYLTHDIPIFMIPNIYDTHIFTNISENRYFCYAIFLTISDYFSVFLILLWLFNGYFLFFWKVLSTFCSCYGTSSCNTVYFLHNGSHTRSIMSSKFIVPTRHENTIFSGGERPFFNSDKPFIIWCVPLFVFEYFKVSQSIKTKNKFVFFTRILTSMRINYVWNTGAFWQINCF